MTQVTVLKIERPQTLTDIAANHIREAIIRGDFRLGEALTEISLSRFLGISKTPVREALSSLKREGLIQSDSQKGVRVFTLTADQLHQLCTYRFTLESAAVDLALENDAEGLCKCLNDICASMAEARLSGSFDSYLKLDRDFHDAFFEFSGNQFLKEGYKSVSHKVSTLRTYLSRAPLRTDKSYSEHLEIAKSLKSGRHTEAKQVLSEQIDRGSNALDEIMKKDSL
ncbi:GntR family transcriptional regulator [Tropicibacter sp. Alg240-R139]|uniref:GntR family transcriptional regulator n=1 Tax=Tropicibacter sp. Alg240-R139 TaxID=2305991 RepID=UPI0013DF1E5D|nr:GntR family transcriptional regulator [Tropicibacter sp. Alg240-R139]